MLEALPGKKPLIKLSLPAAELRDADRIFPHRDHAERCVLRALSPRRHSGGGRQDLELSVGGDGANGTAELTLDELKAMPAVEIVAVCQCSGNRRGLFEPHVAGVEWGYGAMGCAALEGRRG